MGKSNNADSFVEIISTIHSTTNRARVDRTLYSELESALHSESTSVSHWNFLADISSEGQPLLNDSSPINLQFQKMGKARGLTDKEINPWRLQFYGQFSFDIEKEY